MTETRLKDNGQQNYIQNVVRSNFPFVKPIVVMPFSSDLKNSKQKPKLNYQRSRQFIWLQVISANLQDDGRYIHSEKHEKTTNSKSQQRQELYLPNIKPLKPPGFVLSEKHEKQLSRMNTQCTNNIYGNRMRSQRRSLAEEYETMFQQIQIRKLQGIADAKQRQDQYSTSQGGQSKVLLLEEDKQIFKNSLKKMLIEREQVNNLYINPAFASAHTANRNQFQLSSQPASMIKMSLLNEDPLLSNAQTFDNTQQYEAIQDTEDTVVINNQQTLKQQISEMIQSKHQSRRHIREISKASTRISSKLLLVQSINLKAPTSTQNKNQQVINLEEAVKSRPKRKVYRHQSLLFSGQQQVSDGNLCQSGMQSVNSSKSKKIKIEYTTIDPVTDKYYEDKSKRLVFNRKLERSMLPILIVKFDGILGMMSKENMGLGESSFFVRPSLTQLIRTLHPKFQIVVMLDYPKKSKCRIAQKHLDAALNRVNDPNIFYDGVYRQRTSLSYEQILMDFESRVPYENTYIIEPYAQLEEPVSKEDFEDFLPTLSVKQDLTRILVPHIRAYPDYLQANMSLKKLGDQMIQLFSNNTLESPIQTYTYEKRCTVIPFKKGEEESQQEQLRMDLATYGKLQLTNGYIQNQIQKYAERYRKSDDQVGEIVKYTMRYVMIKNTEASKIGLEKLEIQRQGNDEVVEVVRDIAKRKIKQF